MGKWDAVIDVSNVCWSAYLPPEGRRKPLWQRLEAVMGAWRDQHGNGARFVLVADDSLVRTLDDVREFRRLMRAGELATRPVADSLILELARDRRLHVITRDHYIDHRNRHPWIERAPERFHCWETAEDGVRIVPLGITPRSRQTVSEAVERKELQRARLDAKNPRDRRILATRWKCATMMCPEAAHWQDQLLVWPVVDRAGRAVCPSCGEPLLDLGRRDPLYEAVVEERVSQEEIMRFPLELDSPVTVGRGSRLKGVNLGAFDSPHLSAVKRVSRRHLLLRMEADGTNRRLLAADLGTKNGTEVERWAGTAFDPPKLLPAGKDTFLGFKDRLVLADAVTLRLSGRRYVSVSDASGAPDLSGPESETLVHEISP